LSLRGSFELGLSNTVGTVRTLGTLGDGQLHFALRDGLEPRGRGAVLNLKCLSFGRLWKLWEVGPTGRKWVTGGVPLSLSLSLLPVCHKVRTSSFTCSHTTMLCLAMGDQATLD
jgi:hypothetical protein